MDKIRLFIRLILIVMLLAFITSFLYASAGVILLGGLSVLVVMSIWHLIIEIWNDIKRKVK